MAHIPGSQSTDPRPDGASLREGSARAGVLPGRRAPAGFGWATRRRGWFGWAVVLGVVLAGEAPIRSAEARRWADFVEAGFPFIGSVVDARQMGSGFPTNNLTARGVVLPLGHGCWAAFDLDLLRVAAVWRGDGVTPVSMAQGSYHTAGRKAPEGQADLPRPGGRIWLATGLYAGTQAGGNFSTEDPRDVGDDPGEVGRGPLPSGWGRFRSVGMAGDLATFRYETSGVGVEDSLSANATSGGVVVRRRVRRGASPVPLTVALGQRGEGVLGEGQVQFRLKADAWPGPGRPHLDEGEGGLVLLRLPGGPEAAVVEVEMGVGVAWAEAPERGVARDSGRPALRWADEVTTRGECAGDDGAFVVDRVGLPWANPWRRNVRIADLGFRKDGVAFVVTFDGDVWRVTGLAGNLERVGWSRFASGLHEPLGLAVRDGEVFVHDRNGLWRLRDDDGDGEAEAHAMVSMAMVQTAETREFASGLRVAPDGSFVMGKGGQRGVTLGRHSGCVLRISADGERLTVLGHGFRQPFIGVHPTEGWVSVSDQQGHYIPTTPLHLLGADAYHGFLPLILAKERHAEPIEEPVLWIPHAINASAAGQVWLGQSRMGPLNGGLIHLGYYRPEVFSVLLDPREPGRGAAVTSLTRDLDFAPLAGAVNPVDGQLYVAGFQIWGTTAKETSGLARIRYTGRESLLPTVVESKAEGILLRFEVELDRATAEETGNYSIERWNYRRTAAYGSAHYRLDGTKGQESMAASSAYLSRDGRSVFLGVPDMRGVMQMRVGWALRTRSGRDFARNAYLTPGSLPRFDLAGSGFDAIQIDLSARADGVPAEDGPRDAVEGRKVAELMGCVACHSSDGSTLGKVGPSWKGLWGSRRTFAEGGQGVADEAYVRESILEPAARVVEGYRTSDVGMPSYDGVLNGAQVDALIRYIEALR